MPDTVVWELYSESEESEALFVCPVGSANLTVPGGGSGDGVGNLSCPLAGETWWQQRFWLHSARFALSITSAWPKQCPAKYTLPFHNTLSRSFLMNMDSEKN